MHRDIVTELLFVCVEPIADTPKFRFFVSQVVCGLNRMAGNYSLCKPWYVRDISALTVYLVEERSLEN